MARIKWFSYLLNDEGQPIKGADISIYLAGGTTEAIIYTSEIGSETIDTAPQLITNEDGYFEFWVGDSSDINGYSSTQKFKISFNKAGVVSGYNDYISIYSSFIPVDLTSSDNSIDKTVSNLYAQRWENHRLDTTHLVHGIEEVNLLSTDTVKNKLISNLNGYGWENHRNLDYNENPHNIESLEDDSFDLTRNKLVSNRDIKEILDSISGLTFTENISATSLSPSGDYYYSDIVHNLNDQWPIINIYDTVNKEKIIPKEINSIDVNTIRIWLNSKINFTIKINK